MLRGEKWAVEGKNAPHILDLDERLRKPRSL
jgi:hypothetical protein